MNTQRYVWIQDVGFVPEFYFASNYSPDVRDAARMAKMYHARVWITNSRDRSPVEQPQTIIEVIAYA